MKLSGIFMSVGIACLMFTVRTAQALEREVEFSIRDQISFDCATVEFTPDGCVPIEDTRSFKYSISYGSEYVTLTWRGTTSAFSHRCEYRSNTPPTPFRIIEPDGFAYSARRDCAHIDKGDFDQFTIRTKDLDYAPYFEEIVIRIWPGTNECDAMSRIGSLPPTSEQPLPVRLSYYFGSCKWN